MRITEIDTFRIRLPIRPEPFNPNPSWTHMESLLVRIKTDHGITGWGEIFGHAANAASRAALKHNVAPYFIGKDPRAIAALMDGAHRAFHGFGRTGPVLYALSGVDIALWDILAKNAGCPLYRMLGGGSRPTVDAYASLYTYHGDAAVIDKACASTIEQGFRLLKLHETTRDAFLVAKRRAGNDAEVAMDVNCPWSVEQAVQVTRAMRDDGVRWLEEPVWPPDDSAGLARVRQEGVRLSAGENASGMMGLASLITDKSVDIIQPSVCKIGGVSAMRQAIALAEAHGVTVIPHNYYYGPGLLATMHLVAAMGIPAPVELPLVDFEHPLYPSVWKELRDSTLPLPQTPGIGPDPDMDVLQRFAVDD